MAAGAIIFITGVAMFYLKDVIDRHEKDCKSVAYWNGSICSTSRDHTAYVGYMFKGDAFLNSIYVKNGTIYVGSQSGILYRFDGDTKYEYQIHNGNITCISNFNFYIVTGGWDNTVRITNENDFKDSLFVNLPHAVWAVLVVDDFIFAGCADGNIYKLNQKLKILSTIKAHSQPVRSLSKYNSCIASCSNDATIKIWSLNGDLQHEWFGHTSFIYSIATVKLDEDYLISVGEDNCCKIWHRGNIVQNIPIPEQSLWNVSANFREFAIASSSGKVYEFTTNVECKAEESIKAKFDKELSQFCIAKETVDNINIESIPDASILDKPGPKEGHVQMVKELGKVFAYSWSSQKWVKIGEVVNSVGSNHKQIYDGKEYDYLFDVEIDSKMLKMPVNANDNPYSAALTFMNKNSIDHSNLDEIANFIIKNTSSVGTLNSTQFKDPLTGNSGYVPNAVSQELSSMTGTSFDYAKHIHSYFIYQNTSVDKVKSKLIEFNDLYPEKHDIESLFTQNPKSIEVFQSVLHSWKAEHKFPVLDAFRLYVLENNDPTIPVYLFDQEMIKDSDASDDRNVLMLLRAFCNLFQLHESFISTHIGQLINTLAVLMPDTVKSMQVFTAAVLNLSILMVKLSVGKPLYCRNLYQLLGHAIEKKSEEIGYRALLSAKLLVIS
eukprot:NODE_17_length_41373_cov_0.337016.p3 type:complete len:663 gc:universal NODE_17_length_41373_cov_0.337016:268-2256(+)